MIWFRIASFIKFLSSSTNQYGIHSPFIYQFLIKCLYKKLPKGDLKTLKHNRNVVLNRQDYINVKDFGKGSQHFSTSRRQVKDMANKAGMSLHKSKLINKIVGYFNINSALELGTSVGLGSIAMATNHPNVKIETIEACPNTHNVAVENFNKLDLKQVYAVNNTFQQFFLQHKGDKFYDLIYLDGHHDKQATLEYFELLQKHIHENSLIILDDIYWSKDMREAWEELKKDKRVKVSIDLYFWGILFFRPGLSKQDFKIRCFI
jgi:predicted O-methyltransferase YrrM